MMNVPCTPFAPQTQGLHLLNLSYSPLLPPVSGFNANTKSIWLHKLFRYYCCGVNQLPCSLHFNALKIRFIGEQ